MIDAIEKLTALVAAHGIFALTVIFMLVLWNRAYRQLNAATAQDHTYFRYVHGATVGVTFLLTAAASYVWYHVNYSFKPVIWGVMSDLRDQRLDPVTMQDPPSIEQTLMLEPEPDLRFYIDKHEIQLGSGKLQVDWVIRPGRQPTSVRFLFQHRYAVRERDRLTEPGARSPGSSHLRRVTQEGGFTLPLAKLRYDPSNPVLLAYYPDSTAPNTQLGRIVLRRENAADTVIPWTTRRELSDSQSGSASSSKGGPVSSRLWNWLAPFAAAQYTADSIRFGEDGSYDAVLGQLLRQRLGSREFRQQVAAREIVAGQGARGLRFITESLERKAGRGVEDRSLLLRNLGQALAQIEASERKSFPQLWLKLALESYGINDYPSAAIAFRHVDDASLNKRSVFWYYRGYAYYRSGSYSDALSSVRSYLTRAQSKEQKSAAYIQLARIHEELQQGDSAILEYRRALTLDPQNDVAQNNLAYQFAQRGEHLNEALQLVDSALKRDSQSGSYLDTKAWVLYRLGRIQEARAFAERAAARDPNDAEIRQHLDTIQGRTKAP